MPHCRGALTGRAHALRAACIYMDPDDPNWTVEAVLKRRGSPADIEAALNLLRSGDRGLDLCGTDRTFANGLPWRDSPGAAQMIP